MIGSACCSSVRPAITVSRCSRGQARRRVGRACRSASSGASARLATSIAAVSSTSWLVAPLCAGPTWRSALTIGPAGLPISAAA